MYITSIKVTFFVTFDQSKKFQSGYSTHNNTDTALVMMCGWSSSQNTMQILRIFCKGILLKLVALASELNFRKGTITHTALLNV